MYVEAILRFTIASSYKIIHISCKNQLVISQAGSSIMRAHNSEQPLYT